MQSEDILMCPGPNDMSDRVIRAMMRPAAAPPRKSFRNSTNGPWTCWRRFTRRPTRWCPFRGRAAAVWRQQSPASWNPATAPLPSPTGTSGASPCRSSAASAASRRRFRNPGAASLTWNAFAAKLASGSYKLVTLVHNETSSGAVYQAEEIARLAHDHGALFLLDAVSSLAGADLRTDEWDVDLVVSCNHKAIGAPIGHAHVVVGERAWEAWSGAPHPAARSSPT